MYPFRSFLIWLLAPLPRLRGAPLRFRKKLDARHHGTDYYAGSITTADKLMSSERTPLPALVYHDFRFTWKGQEYRLYWNDRFKAHAPRHLTHPYPVWIDPWDLSSVWFLTSECKVTPVRQEEEEDEPEEGPLVAIDVHYDGDKSATAAAVFFTHWQAETAFDTITTTVSPIAPYEPGAFYKRELPCILALLEKMETPPYLVVIDGYVTLGPNAVDGLGMHLYRALNEEIPVIGVAKNRFKDTPQEAELRRGESKHPLYVTAVGVSQESAKAFIRWMHGAHRMPTLLTAVDRLCRDGTTSADCPSTPGD